VLAEDLLQQPARHQPPGDPDILGLEATLFHMVHLRAARPEIPLLVLDFPGVVVQAGIGIPERLTQASLDRLQILAFGLLGRIGHLRRAGACRFGLSCHGRECW